MNETLKELAHRRLAEIGKQRGGGPQSLLAAYDSLPIGSDGKRAISYETARRIVEEGHTNISNATASAFATMVGVHMDEVLIAAGKRPSLGRFDLPARADRLDRKERKVVLAVIDAILDAAEGKRSSDVAPAAKKSVSKTGETPKQADYTQAARKGKSEGRRLRREQDEAGEESQDPGGDS